MDLFILAFMKICGGLNLGAIDKVPHLTSFNGPKFFFWQLGLHLVLFCRYNEGLWAIVDLLISSSLFSLKNDGKRYSEAIQGFYFTLFVPCVAARKSLTEGVAGIQNVFSLRNRSFSCIQGLNGLRFSNFFFFQIQNHNLNSRSLISSSLSRKLESNIWTRNFEPTSFLTSSFLPSQPLILGLKQNGYYAMLISLCLCCFLDSKLGIDLGAYWYLMFIWWEYHFEYAGLVL